MKKKYIRKVNIKPNDEINYEPFTCPERISLQKVKDTVRKDGTEINDEEAIRIRDFLYSLAETIFLHLNKKETLQVTINKDYKHEESDSLYQGEYRRAS